MSCDCREMHSHLFQTQQPHRSRELGPLTGPGAAGAANSRHLQEEHGKSQGCERRAAPARGQMRPPGQLLAASASLTQCPPDPTLCCSQGNPSLPLGLNLLPLACTWVNRSQADKARVNFAATWCTDVLIIDRYKSFFMRFQAITFPALKTH